ncbi:cytochrome c [bacterium]|nr:cytochrome c [bacterium]
MLSKSAAKTFFIVGTFICTGIFVVLTIDTFKKLPGRTHTANITAEVARGKDLWDKNNCMGCHTLLGEGAYYAPELTKVYERRGEAFIHSMLTDPSKMYPGERKMVQYNFSEQDKKDLIEFFKWIGNIDTNGFPAKPNLAQVALPVSDDKNSVAAIGTRPQIFNQMCVACHSLGGQGGQVGPSLDGVGSRRDIVWITRWLHDPLSVKPDAKMPRLPLSDEEITELAAFLSEVKN